MVFFTVGGVNVVNALLSSNYKPMGKRGFINFSGLLDDLFKRFSSVDKYPNAILLIYDKKLN